MVTYGCRIEVCFSSSLQSISSLVYSLCILHSLRDVHLCEYTVVLVPPCRLLSTSCLPECPRLLAVLARLAARFFFFFNLTSHKFSGSWLCITAVLSPLNNQSLASGLPMAGGVASQLPAFVYQCLGAQEDVEPRPQWQMQDPGQDFCSFCFFPIRSARHHCILFSWTTTAGRISVHRSLS